MTLNDMLFLSVPMALTMFKLGVLVVAAVWAIGSLFQSRSLLPNMRREPLPVRARLRP
ncbi:MAG: hypothetical protein PVI91_07445 [Gammaproteobacteria bacterium]